MESEKEVKYLTKKERRQIPRQHMPELAPEIRNKCFDEVTLGYSLHEAQLEAARCIQCKDPQCIVGCPVSINIPSFLEQIVEGDLDSAINTVWDKTALPAVCGRVCPQEMQCEVVCVVGLKKGREPVGIGNLEMFIADWARDNGVKNIVEIPPKTGKKVAVIGSGPAGITVAGDLAKKGHEVVIYEALHKAGGVLLYGIPEFRLAKDIVDYELDALRELGVKIECNNVIGRTIDIDELLEEMGFDAAFIGVGAGLLMKKYIGYTWLLWLGVFWGVAAAILNIRRAYLKQKADLDTLKDDPKYKHANTNYDDDEDDDKY